MLNPEYLKLGLNNFGLNATGTQHVFKNFSLKDQNIDDITPLSTYIYLEYIDLTNNKIKDLMALGCMKYLIELKASYNNITMLLNFKPPLGLKVVDMSHNQISSIPDLFAFTHLQWLSLSNNAISKMEGLEKCVLAYLNLEGNQITRIEGIQCLPLRYLNLAFNNIKTIENLDSLTKLQIIDLSHNNIRSLSGLVNLTLLESINISTNEIIDLSEIDNLSSLLQLRNLDLTCNPVLQGPESHLAIVFKLQLLTMLNNQPISSEEKVAAVNLFSPSLMYVASRDHMMHVVYSFMRPNHVLDMTLPSLKMNYPILILVGPQGTSKTWLAQKLAEDFSEHFAFALSCTTRSPRLEEKHEFDYNFVSLEEFEMLIKMGQFLQTTSRHNELYGTTIQTIECVAKEALACILRMEIEGILTIKQTNLRPLCVYILPKDMEAFERRLNSLGFYTNQQILEILERVKMYQEFIKNNMDANDTVIFSDDPMDSYKQLKEMVHCFLSTSQNDLDSSISCRSHSAPTFTDTFNTNMNQNKGFVLPKMKEDEHKDAVSSLNITSSNNIKWSVANSLPLTPRQSSSSNPSTRPFTAPLLSLDLNSLLSLERSSSNQFSSTLKYGASVHEFKESAD